MLFIISWEGTLIRGETCSSGDNLDFSLKILSFLLKFIFIFIYILIIKIEYQIYYNKRL